MVISVFLRMLTRYGRGDFYIPMVALGLRFHPYKTPKIMLTWRFLVNIMREVDLNKLLVLLYITFFFTMDPFIIVSIKF